MNETFTVPEVKLAVPQDEKEGNIKNTDEWWYFNNLNYMSFKVDVNKDEIQAGQQMILCLADQELLNGDELNEAEDILENEEIKV